jgi:hypothetical protein
MQSMPITQLTPPTFQDITHLSRHSPTHSKELEENIPPHLQPHNVGVNGQWIPPSYPALSTDVKLKLLMTPLRSILKCSQINKEQFNFKERLFTAIRVKKILYPSVPAPSKQGSEYSLSELVVSSWKYCLNYTFTLLP